MRRILVTGGAGYIGCRLVPALVARGWQVRVLDTFWFGTRPLQIATEGLLNVEVVAGDVRDSGKTRECVRDVDAVIHLAGLSNDASAALDIGLATSINLIAVRELALLAAERGVRKFVNMSSASVYGRVGPDPVSEAHGLNPQSLYANLKALSEGVVIEAATGSEMSAVNLRVATVCGASPRLRLDLFVNTFVVQALARRVIRVSGGAQWRPSIHVDDLVEGMLSILEYDGEIANESALNVAGENTTVKAAARRVQKALLQSGASATVEVRGQDDNRSYSLDTRLLTETIGFIPRLTLEDAAAQVARMIQHNPIQALSDPIYYNISQLQAQMPPTAFRPD